ncbi:MAG: hypothetical protein FJZ09_04915 [Candidatus Omnitrophica bacterium]|nr:hypothetical protein [Candidatus Omnitrophota bacterium]
MRKLKSLLAVLFCFGLSGFSPDCSFAVEKIVAIVNNEVITQKELSDFLSYMRIQLSREIKGKELEQKLQSMKLDLLNELIRDRLILQQARKMLDEARKKTDKASQMMVYLLEVDKNRVRARINEMKKRYPSEADFHEALAKQGLTQADLETRIKDEMLKYNVVQLKIDSEIAIRPEEVTLFYNKNPQEFKSPEEREMTVIALENRDQAQSFSYNLKRGEKLESLASRYPIKILPDKLIAAKDGELKPEVESAVFSLPLGAASDALDIDGKHFVFIVDKITPSRQLPIAEVQAQISDFLFSKKRQEKLDKWLDEIKKSSYVEIRQN